MRKTGLMAGWAALVLGVAVAADEPKTSPMKAADWSGYATASKVAGTVADVSETGVTISIPGAPNPRSKSQPKDTQLELAFAPGAMVRWNKMPVEKDEKGNKKQMSPSRQMALKLPAGAPGYAATREDLTAGQIVEITLVRPKEVSATKAVQSDLRVKYVVILGDDPRGAPGSWEKEKAGAAKAKEKEKEKAKEKEKEKK